ncbi:Inactive beta-amylase 9 [Acorus gramineus]|uniref:Beta-amylase n=1 Tax=Acorus gramineus TaxID=55184 RepID=A0AAV9BR06_ACOGR|nr:Inactive beta-amylase 9 [Acorus gramineus]
MEVLMIGGCQASSTGLESAVRDRNLVGLCPSQGKVGSRAIRIGFGGAAPSARRDRNVAIRAVRSVSAAAVEERSGKRGPSDAGKSKDRLRLFVGLPLDAVSDGNTVNHTKAIAAGLKALKLLGADGVEFPIWWGVVEKEAVGQYDWSGYMKLAEMVREAGLDLRVSLCFHANGRNPAIPLPQWVSRIAESEPDIYFTDRARKRYKDCLSLAVDNLPVLNGKTPVQVYGEFLQSFKDSFSGFFDSTITDIMVGLGPDGELRYPSTQAKTRRVGVGEFQCYDKHMLEHLKQHAHATGNPLWGLSGPHDVPQYDQGPDANTFFKEVGGSWETPYGNFFLSWYSNQLLSHGDRLLALASDAFADSAVNISAKLPLMHSYYINRSHPSELTAGFHNTVNQDGYDAFAEMFARYSCQMVLPGVNLSDEQNQGLKSSPESLFLQIMEACKKHGVGLIGENSLGGGADQNGFDRIRENLQGLNAIVYQRMGAYFFSPEHWPMFTAFIRSLDRDEERHSDDLPSEGDGVITSSAISVGERESKMQVA